MRKARKRVLSALLAAVLALGLMPSFAFATTPASDTGEGAGVSALATKTVNSAEEFSSAIDSAQSGDVISLGRDVSAELPSFTEAEILTFDLGGHTLTLTNTAGVSVENGADITFENGTLVANGVDGGVNTAVITVTSNSSFTLNKVAYNTNKTGMLVRGDAAALNVVNGSEINATGYCFGTNASKENNYNVVITLEDSTFNGSDDGAGTALYINVPGQLNIDSCQINGYFQGAIVRGGTAVIKDSVITNTRNTNQYKDYFENTGWGSGNTVNLAALTLGNKNNSAYVYPTKVTLVNTTITSAGTCASDFPAIYAWANESEGDGVTVSYDNCTINGKVVYGNGGKNISATVTNGVAKVGDTQYLTLADAVTAVPAGGSIVLLKNASGAGIGTFNGDSVYGVKNFTIDFGGYTYTCTGPAVGSSGTESQAFHLEWTGDGVNNANVTLKNGTITSTVGSGVRMLVQNYCNLTLDGVTLDGSNMGAGDYALSNNCGNVTIKDTTIIASTGGVAFDVCDYSTYTGVTVTVEGKSVIRGAVEVVNHNGGDNNATLIVKGGTFTTDKVATNYQGATAELLDYLAEDYTLQYNDDTYTVVERPETAAEVVADTPSVTLPEGLGETDQNAAAEVKGALEDRIDLVTGTGINAAATTVANNNTVSDEKGKQALTDDGVVVGSDDQVTIVIQPYMDVVIEGLSIENQTIALDITPMYKTVATTADLSNPDDEIVLAGSEGGIANAVQIGEAQKLTITKPVTVTVPLPDGFAGGAETLYVEHQKSAGRTYFYTGAVADDVLTFTNPNGFSLFTISAANGAEAELNDVGYGTLSSALADAGDGDTVTVLQNNLTASMSGASRDVRLENGTDAAITVTINGKQVEIAPGETKTFSYSAPAPVPTPEQFDVAVADVQNGAVELSAKTAKEGQKVTVTVTPDLGWELAQLTVADEDGDALELTENADGTYSFTMPAGDVTVHASFADAWENPFTDLSEDHWGYGAVRTANLLGLMKGIGGTTLFGPDDGLLREQAATVMWNLMGAGDVSRPEAPQADVDQSQWYAPYVNWAVDSKVMDGYSEDDFGVGDSLTREQFAAVVAKAVGADVDSADQAALGAFPDADGVSGWARATMAWAVEAGVLNGVGTEDGSRELQATRELTRAEMATMMVNAIEVGVLDFGA